MTSKAAVGLSHPLHHGRSSPHPSLPPDIFWCVVTHRCLPIPGLGYMGAGTGLMLRDKSHPAASCPYHFETAASGWPGVCIPIKPSVSFLTGLGNNYSGWQGPQEVSTRKPDHLWGHTRLLRSWSSKPPRTELAQPHRATPSLTLLFQLLPSYHAPPQRAHLHPDDFPVGTGELLGPPKAISRLNKPKSFSLPLKQCRDAKYQQNENPTYL